jgi:hypothetical protein
MEKIKNVLAHKIFKILKWAFLILAGLFVVLVIIRVFHFFNLDKTNAQVEKIHAMKITIDDVMGKNLPPDPGIEADKTVQGIDANKNGIRDDVELAVFKEYPNSAKTRGTLLQYALASQMQLTQPFMNTVLATEIAREHSRADSCVADTLVPRKTPESWRNTSEIEKIEEFIFYIDEITFNTDARNQKRDFFYKQIRSYSPLEKVECDIDYSKLSY